MEGILDGSFDLEDEDVLQERRRAIPRAVVQTCPSTPWRTLPRTCDCPLMSKHCECSLATCLDIFQAAEHGDLAALTWYLELDDEEREEVLCARDESGRTIFHLLARCGDAQAMASVIWRLDSTLHLDRKERNRWGRTPIMLAAMGGDLPMVRVLAAERVRMRTKSEEGKRAVDYAAEHPHVLEWMVGIYAGKIDHERSIVHSGAERTPSAYRRLRRTYRDPSRPCTTSTADGSPPASRPCTCSSHGRRPNSSCGSSPARQSPLGQVQSSHGGARRPELAVTVNTSPTASRPGSSGSLLSGSGVGIDPQGSPGPMTHAQRQKRHMKQKLRLQARARRLIPELPVARDPKMHQNVVTITRRIATGEQLAPPNAISPGGAVAPATAPAGLGSVGPATWDERGRLDYLESCGRHGAKVRNDVLRQLADSDLLTSKGGVGVSDVAPVAAALRANRFIQVVHLEDCDLRDAGGEALVRAMAGGGVAEVIMMRCRLRVRTARALAEWVGGWGCKLERLILDKNHVGDVGAGAIAQALVGGVPPLTHLSLSSNEIGRQSGKAVATLCGVLNTNSTLTQLDLSWNTIGPKACADILTALAQSTSLKALSLAWNRVGNPGADAICRVLEENSGLERLDLTSCGVPGSYVGAFVQAMQPNTALQILKLDNNRFGFDGGMKLSAALAAKKIRFSISEVEGPAGRVVGSADTMVSNYNEGNPSGRWRLHLSNPNHRAVAEKLAEQADQFDGECWRNEKYNGHRFSYHKGWQLPDHGWLELDFIHLEPNDPELYGVMEEKDFHVLCRILNNLRSSQTRLNMLRKMAANYVFDPERSMALLFLCDQGEERIQAAAALAPRVSDRDGMFMAMSPLSVSSKEEVYARCGPFMFYDPYRCTKLGFKAVYRLDLAKMLDHRFLYKLVEMAANGNPHECYFIRAEFQEGQYSGPWNAAIYNLELFDQAMKGTLLGEGWGWTYTTSGRIRELPSVGSLVVVWDEVDKRRSGDTSPVSNAEGSPASPGVWPSARGSGVPGQSHFGGADSRKATAPAGAMREGGDEGSLLPNGHLLPRSAPVHSLHSGFDRRGMWTMDDTAFMAGRPKTATDEDMMSVHTYGDLNLGDMKGATSSLSEIVNDFKAHKLGKAAQRKKESAMGHGAHLMKERWACPVCQLPFVQESNLMFHIESVHLHDDFKHNVDQRKMQIFTRCYRVEGKISELQQLIATGVQLKGDVEELERRAKEDRDFLRIVDDVGSDDDERYFDEIRINLRMVVPRLRKPPATAVSSFEGLSYSLEDYSWQFDQEKDQPSADYDVIHFEDSQPEVEEEHPPQSALADGDYKQRKGAELLAKSTKMRQKAAEQKKQEDLATAMNERRLYLLRKYREGTNLSSSKSAIKDAMIQRGFAPAPGAQYLKSLHASVAAKARASLSTVPPTSPGHGLANAQDDIGGVKNGKTLLTLWERSKTQKIDRMAQQQMKEIQEQHGALLSWMD